MRGLQLFLPHSSFLLLINLAVLAVLALFVCLFFVGYYEDTVDDSGK